LRFINLVKLSLITNSNSNLITTQLQKINRSLSTTQLRLTTGLRINGPQDDPAAFSISSRIRGDKSGLEAVKIALLNGESAVDTAVAGATAITDLLTEIKTKVIQGNTASLDAATRTTLNTDITALLNQISTTVGTAEFENINLIKTDASTFRVLSSLSGSVINVSAQILDITALGINSISVLTSAVAASALTSINTAITLAADRASALGSSAKGIEIQADFTTSLINVIDEGLGNIVDADLAEESARLQALQIQQELAVQGLAIANALPKLLTQLFAKE